MRFMLTVNLLCFIINREFSSPFFLIYLILINKGNKYDNKNELMLVRNAKFICITINKSAQ